MLNHGGFWKVLISEHQSIKTFSLRHLLHCVLQIQRWIIATDLVSRLTNQYTELAYSYFAQIEKRRKVA